MKYHDTGSRNPSEALSTWLQEVLTDEVAEFRVQTGYFSARALGLIVPILERAASADLVTNVLLGSNDASTLKTHVEELFELMGMPRANAQLGIVSFGRGLFHPKVYHVCRRDGTQAAFVGSANLTREGLALNIEAAISLDTRDGDDDVELRKIATAIDDWFVPPLRDGITLVDSVEVIDQLLHEGILAAASPPRIHAGGAGTGIPGPTLTALMPLPVILLPTAGPADVAEDDFEQPTPPVAATPAVVVPAPAPLVAAGPVVAPAGVLRFGMTLQNTDVGVGQTDPIQVTQRRSPEVFVPMRALDLNPAFWGWPANYVIDQAWARSNAAWIANELLKPVNPLRPRKKVDWHGCNIRLVGRPGLIAATIWHNPKKNDIRIRAEDLRSAGNVGDIFVMWPAPAGAGYDYVVEVVPATSPIYATTMANLTVHIPNSQKVIGYF